MTKKGKFYQLKEEVIDPGFCVLCGACSGFCDRIELDYEGAAPRLVEPCVIGCSNCYDQCPMRVDFNPIQVFGKAERDPILGPYTEIKAVRAANEGIRKNSQDGGAVTAILTAIMERGKIDAAVVVERDEKWKPIPRIITSKEELSGSKGSKYSPSPNAETLGEVFRTMEVKSVALVDVGCHIRSIRNMEFDILYNAGFSPYSDLKIYTIGLFCSGSFYHKSLLRFLKEEPERIKRMDVTSGRFIAVSNHEEAQPVRAMKGAFMPS
ncbi:MAG: coenzyme F420 hydrogenase/dehydrogenase beta subunit N-terminal domain-containing protein, partial [Candidatus Hydrothermarchaeales archaeon]